MEESYRTPEGRARVKIDRLLTAAGWIVRIHELRPTERAVVVLPTPTPRPVRLPYQLDAEQLLLLSPKSPIVRLGHAQIVLGRPSDSAKGAVRTSSCGHTLRWAAHK